MRPTTIFVYCRCKELHTFMARIGTTVPFYKNTRIMNSFRCKNYVSHFLNYVLAIFGNFWIYDLKFETSPYFAIINPSSVVSGQEDISGFSKQIPVTCLLLAFRNTTQFFLYESKSQRRAADEIYIHIFTYFFYCNWVFTRWQ